MNLNLNKSQAKGVYDALCALRRVKGAIDSIKLADGLAFVVYDGGGGYGVSVRGQTSETYETLAEFSIAYRLIPTAAEANARTRATMTPKEKRASENIMKRFAEKCAIACQPAAPRQAKGHE